MKKILSVILVIVVIFTMTASFSACGKKSDTDTTDSSSSDIVNESTSEKKEDKDSEDNTTKADKKDTTKADNNSKTTAKTTNKNTTKKNTTKKSTTEKKTTEKKTTTKAAQKRDAYITVKLPNYNNEEHELLVRYKVKNGKSWDKKWTEVKPVKVILDGSEKKIKLDKIKGRIKVEVCIDNFEYKDDSFNRKLQSGCNVGFIESDEKTYHFNLVTGIEMMEDWD